MMKKTLVLLLSLLFIYGSILAVDYNGLFEKANSEYSNQNYENALNIYKKIEKEVKDFKLFYNMGNCYYKTGDFLMAKVYYLKAKRINPLDADLIHNINLVNKKFKDDIVLEKISWIQKVLIKIENLLSINFLYFVLLILIFVFNYNLYNIIRSKKKKISVYLLFTSIILSLLLYFYIGYRVNKNNSHELGIISKDNVKLYSSPNKNETVLFNVNKGLDVRIIDKKGDFYQVSSSKGIAGFVSKEDLIVI